MGEVRWQGQGPPMQREWDAQENQNVQPLALPPMAGETNTPAAGLTNAGAVPQGPAAQQGAAGIPPVEKAGMAIAPPIIGHHVTPPPRVVRYCTSSHSPNVFMTDADTSRNLRWQRDVNGDAAKVATWKIEATSQPSLQFFAYMQPGDAFLVVGHSMPTIYSTATDIASFHGKIVLFTGDRKGTRECVPVVLPPQSAFEWKKCMVLDNATALQDWYANNTTQYGKLWNPQPGDGQKVEVNVPRLIALPLRAAQLYHKRGGAVTPHELMADIESHLASPDTNLGNGDEWVLIKTWLQVAAQTEGGQGTQARPKSHIAFSTDAILTNPVNWSNGKLGALVKISDAGSNSNIQSIGPMATFAFK